MTTHDFSSTGSISRESLARPHPFRTLPAGTQSARRQGRRIASLLSIPALVMAAAFLSGCTQAKQTGPAANTTTNEIPTGASIDTNSYYAVLLTNGAVYFGKLEGFGSPWPVLHDVFYVQAGPVDPSTKQSSGMVLVHRGHELHGPDRMILNEKSIVFVEPVGASSRVAQLIKQAK